VFERNRRAHPLSLPIPPLLVAGYGYGVAHKLVSLEPLEIVETATRGVVSANFLLCLLAIIVMLLLILPVGRIRLDDLGLNRDYLGRGIGVVAMIWGASQVLGVIPRVVANRAVLLDRDFEYGSRWDLAGQFLTALGNATLEELAFRGFLLVQLYLLFNRNSGDKERGVTWATLLTVLIADLATLPRALPYPSPDIAATDQAILLVSSLFFCWLYLRTRNLFFVIGVHGLLLAPSAIVAGPRGGGSWYHPLVIAILASLWALLWPRRD
jgi:membrane protease YdiL (CAAX protease family)